MDQKWMQYDALLMILRAEAAIQSVQWKPQSLVKAHIDDVKSRPVTRRLRKPEMLHRDPEMNGAIATGAS
jgi:hypothetical protein